MKNNTLHLTSFTQYILCIQAMYIIHLHLYHRDIRRSLCDQFECSDEVMKDKGATNANMHSS